MYFLFIFLVFSFFTLNITLKSNCMKLCYFLEISIACFLNTHAAESIHIQHFIRQTETDQSRDRQSFFLKGHTVLLLYESSKNVNKRSEMLLLRVK